jgi:hypothetical protein
LKVKVMITIFHKLNKGQAASYGLNLVAFIFILGEIPCQGAECSRDPVIVGMKEVLNQRSNTSHRFFMYGGGSRCGVQYDDFLGRQ